MTRRTAGIDKLTPLAPGIPGGDALEVYQRDGVACLRGAFSDEWIEKDRCAVAAALRAGSLREQYSSHRAAGEKGRFFYDSSIWSIT